MGLVPGTVLKASVGPMRARGGPGGLGSVGVSERMMGSLRLEMERGSEGAFDSVATSAGNEGSLRLETDRWGGSFGFDSVAAALGIEGSFRFETERERIVWAFFGSSTTADIVGMVGCVRDFGIRIEAGRRGIARIGLGSLMEIGAEFAV